jgi:glycosyltransferase involved in cell wall biosynthesis
MRCLIVNHTPIEGSGSGTYILAISKHLRAHGVKPFILTPDVEEKQFLIEDDILCRTFKLSLSGCEESVFPSFTGHPKSTLCYHHLTDSQILEYRDQWLKAILQMIKEQSIDLVHTQHVFLIASLAEEINIPMVATSHGSEFHFLMRNADNLACTLMKKSLNHLSELFFISRYVYSLFLESGLKTFDAPTIIYSGYNDQVFNLELLPSEKSKEPLLLAIGRFVKYKRFDIFLKAISHVRKIYPTVQTALIGSGPMYDELKLIALEAGVQMPGYLPAHEIACWLHSAHLLVMPSEYEPFGLVALESLACGIPVIGSNSGGLAEIINDSVGKLITGWEPLRWAEAIIDSLRGIHKYEKTALNKRAKSFTWTEAVTRLIEGYESALNNKRMLIK